MMMFIVYVMSNKSPYCETEQTISRHANIHISKLENTIKELESNLNPMYEWIEILVQKEVLDRN